MVRIWLVVLLPVIGACSSRPKDASPPADDEVTVLKEARFEGDQGGEVSLRPGIYRVARTGEQTLRVSSSRGTHLLRTTAAAVEGTIDRERAILATREGEPPRLLWISKRGSVEAVPMSGTVRSRGLLQPIRLAPASLTVLDPTTASRWCAGSRKVIRWRQTNMTTASVTITLFRQVSGTLQWAAAIASAAPNPLSSLTNSYTWPIPKTLAPGSYAVYVQSPDGIVRDHGDLFQILAPAAFRGIGVPGAADVSGDGTVVVGSVEGTRRAFRWTPATGPQYLPVGGAYASGETVVGEVHAVSRDGSTIVGGASTASGLIAFRWTAAGGMLLLPRNMPELPSLAVAASASGAAVLGLETGMHGPVFPFLWTIEGGSRPLDAVPERNWRLKASMLLDDAETVLGVCSDEPGVPASPGELFRWTPAGGVVRLGVGGMGYDAPYPKASGDGAVIGGRTWSGQAFRWTAATGVRVLGEPPGGAAPSQVLDMSGDGSVLVGVSSVGDRQEVTVWDAAHGTRLLRTAIADCGGSTGSWELRTTRVSISADGRTIVGGGINPAGQPDSWIVTFPASPPP